MGLVGRRFGRLLLVAASMFWLTGCLGLSQNPSYFPHLWPTGDIIPTHAKPPGFGYYSNFDPHAVRLEVRPKQQVVPVQTQYVLLATVYDRNNKPRRKRRVEWMVEGVGNIVEVDESGFLPGRGYKMDNKYGVSYTNYGTHLITRGNLDPKDDFTLRPGQSWCVISSAVEGDTHVTVYAPGIADWEARKQVVNIRWVDVLWSFPPPASARSGAQHVFTTKVFRYSDKQPLANYRVRYRIAGGAPAMFVPNQTQEAVVVSDLEGNAQVAVAQTAPAQGVTQVEVEIIRPPDPTKPSGSGIVIAKGVTSVEWLAPSVSLNHSGPAEAALGQEIACTIAITNTGKIETQSMTVTNPIPDGMTFLRSNPPAVIDDNTLTWTMGRLAAGQTHTIRVVFQGTKTGTINNCAAVVTEEGLKDQKCFTTQITEPRLKLSITGPNRAVVGVPIAFNINLQNPGNGAAQNVLLTANLSKGLEPQELPEEEKATRVITSQQGTLKGLETRAIPLNVIPREVGKQVLRVTATADGNLKDEASIVVDVTKPDLEVSISGPPRKYIGGPAEWNITASNSGDVPLDNVVVRDVLPPQLIFENATGGGTLKNNQVVWELGTLPARQQRIIQLRTRCGRTPAVVNHTVEVLSEFNLRRSATAAFKIEGVPAVKLEAIDVGDPVEIGKQVKYTIEVTNTGSEATKDLELIAKIPEQMKPLAANGPTASKIEGQVVSFAKVISLEPNKKVVYEVDALAQKPGDVRFYTEIKAATLKQSIYEEESTTIVDPSAPVVAPPLNVPPIGPPVPPNNGTSTDTSPVAVPIVPPPPVPPTP